MIDGSLNKFSKKKIVQLYKMAFQHEIYIEKYLIPEVLGQFKNEELISFKIENSAGLDGFMSCLYNIQLTTKTSKGEKEHHLIAKFMRGDVDFRQSSKSYIQFANEIYIYHMVLPYYYKFLKDMKLNESIRIMDLVPPIYKAQFGYIEGLSSTTSESESILVMENLKSLGYKLGPRLILNKDHLLTMCISIGKYHALSYALRVLNNEKFESLKAGIVPLPFINDNDPNDVSNIYRVIYRHAFDRIFEFYERKLENNTFDQKSPQDLKFVERMLSLKEKYFEEPTRLMENIRTKIENKDDKHFGAILHGDYNRNNVLFKYKPQQGNQEPLVEEMKMIDFQELRYGSPCLDLSFFMYFNTNENERSKIWLDLLRAYHESMHSNLSLILNKSSKSKSEIDKILVHYSFEKFMQHFKRFGLYGAIICLHFLPWILCSEEECNRFSETFTNDLCGEEFRKLSLEAGGDDVNERLLIVMRHACEMGYMDDL